MPKEKTLKPSLPDLIEEAKLGFFASLTQGEPMWIIGADAARALRQEFSFDVFLDVTAVDWPGQDPRFEVVWHFYSSSHKVRVRVKTRVPEPNPSVPSLTALYGSAAFMERECHEMYGIGFEGNSDLRPLLLYEGFVGHPLRKDYPKEREQPLVPYRPGFELGDRG